MFVPITRTGAGMFAALALTFTLLAAATHAAAQNPITVAGQVTAQLTGQPIVGVTVHAGLRHTVTDVDGHPTKGDAITRDDDRLRRWRRDRHCRRPIYDDGDRRAS